MSDKHGLVIDIEKETISNNDFRKVLYTSEHSQLVLMSIPPREDIGVEVHTVDQFFKIEQGSGVSKINGKEYPFKTGFSISVPAGSKHNILNTGNEDLKLYSIYSPPNHKDQTIHATKDIAKQDDEKFDGKLSENISNKLNLIKLYLNEWSNLGNITSKLSSQSDRDGIDTHSRNGGLFTADKKVIKKQNQLRDKKLKKISDQLDL